MHSVSLRIQSKYGKLRTGITPNTDTFYAVMLFLKNNICMVLYIVVCTNNYGKKLMGQSKEIKQKWTLVRAKAFEICFA